MAGKFQLRQFGDINLSDHFFDTLKADYPGNEHSTGFVDWFHKKTHERKTALVFEDDEGIGAFICLKPETEKIELEDRTLPAVDRVKISTIKIDNRYRGRRIGEGAIGLTLWQWQKMRKNEIYVTVFEKHDGLILLLEKFGFEKAGKNLNGELVYIHDRRRLDYSDPFKCFPFIDPKVDNAGYIIIEDTFHDSMFPYSELKNTLQESVGLSVENGLSKIYVGKASTVPYKIGQPVFIYRKHTGDGVKKYKSCLTSYCIVTDIIRAKVAGRTYISFEDLMSRIGNKSVYDEAQLRARYNFDANMNVIEMLYFGFFGEGHNVNMDWLNRNGCWPNGGYPTNYMLSRAQFEQILREASVDVENVIID